MLQKINLLAVVRRSGQCLGCGLLACVLAAGCSGPNEQLTRCQEDKEQLLSTIREQRDANRQMYERLATAEQRLDESEKELARRSPAGTQVSSRQIEVAPLPWRSPPGGASASKPGIANTRDRTKQEATSTAAKPSSASPLAALAEHDRRLAYDRQAKSARFDIDIGFEETSANLSAEGKRQLDELARLLKSKEAAELRVMVSGYAEGRPASGAGEGEPRFTSARQLGAARAQAVADYLDRHGIAEQRLGVTGVGSPGPRIGTGAERLASNVQIHLLEPDVPVLGWDPAGEAIRR